MKIIKTHSVYTDLFVSATGVGCFFILISQLVQVIFGETILYIKNGLGLESYVILFSVVRSSQPVINE